MNTYRVKVQAELEYTVTTQDAPTACRLAELMLKWRLMGDFAIRQKGDLRAEVVA